MEEEEEKRVKGTYEDTQTERGGVVVFFVCARTHLGITMMVVVAAAVMIYKQMVKLYLMRVAFLLCLLARYRLFPDSSLLKREQELEMQQ